MSIIVKYIETGTLLDFNLYLAKDSDVVKYAKEIAITLKDYYNIASGIGESNNYSSNAVNIIIKANTYKRIIHKAEYLNKLLNKNNMNMNSELLLEKIFIELKDVVS